MLTIQLMNCLIINHTINWSLVIPQLDYEIYVSIHLLFNYSQNVILKMHHLLLIKIITILKNVLKLNIVILTLQFIIIKLIKYYLKLIKKVEINFL